MQYNLPPNLLSSLCWVESKHNVYAHHVNDGGSDSFGICQIKYNTAKHMGFKGTKQQLMEPINNINYAAAYLSYQLVRYNNNPKKAVIAYNRGHAKKLTKTNYQVRVFKHWRSIN